MVPVFPLVYGTCISIFLWYMYFHFSMVHLFPLVYGTCISIFLWYIYFHFSMVHLFPLVYGTCISNFLWYIYFHFSMVHVALFLMTIQWHCRKDQHNKTFYPILSHVFSNFLLFKNCSFTTLKGHWTLKGRWTESGLSNRVLLFILKRSSDCLLYTKREMSRVLFYDKIRLFPHALTLTLHITKQYPVNKSFPKN